MLMLMSFPSKYFVCISYNRLLIFEALLVSHVVAGLFGFFDWYNEIDDGLYLGRSAAHTLPLYVFIKLMSTALEMVF